MNTTKIILTMGILSTFFGCEKKGFLTDEEKNICVTISFDEKIAESVKQRTKSSINLLPEISEYGEVLLTKDNGLCSLLDEQEGYEYVVREKENFKAKGYLLFLYEDNEYKRYVGIIKGNDELEIIKWRQTNGINYDYENKDIIEKLQKWREQNDFIILGASTDWLQLQFKTMPNDMDSFAKDVYEFCPDVIDQGAGDMPNLIKEINRMHGVYLWWD
jgi:hypothetical protein